LSPFDVLNAIGKTQFSEKEVVDSGLSVPLLVEWLSKSLLMAPLADYIINSFLRQGSVFRERNGVYFAYLLTSQLIPKHHKIKWIKDQKVKEIVYDENLLDALNKEFPYIGHKEIIKLLNEKRFSKEQLENIFYKHNDYGNSRIF